MAVWTTQLRDVWFTASLLPCPPKPSRKMRLCPALALTFCIQTPRQPGLGNGDRRTCHKAGVTAHLEQGMVWIILLQFDYVRPGLKENAGDKSNPTTDTTASDTWEGGTGCNSQHGVVNTPDPKVRVMKPWLEHTDMGPLQTVVQIVCQNIFSQQRFNPPNREKWHSGWADTVPPAPQ